MNFFVRKFLIFFFQFLLLFIWYAFYVYETVIKYEKSVFEGRGLQEKSQLKGPTLGGGGDGWGSGLPQKKWMTFFGGGGTFQRKYEIQLNLQITWIKTV